MQDLVHASCMYVCAGHLQELLPDIVLILGSEVLVDWIKHAFLLKFNNIEPEVCVGVYFTVLLVLRLSMCARLEQQGLFLHD